MVSELLLEAVNLMFIGMVAVFAFLLLLVFIVQLISFSVQRYFPVTIIDKQPNISDDSDSVPPAVVAAISVAIQQYRQQP